MRKKEFILIIFQILLIGQLSGQTPCSINALNGTLPTKCLEIESVLVNACTNSEGYDEMARVKIGPNAIQLKNLSNVKWATANPWQGWATWDATNLAKLVTINNLIQNAGNCGKVIKLNPTDVIPAYSNLLIITSTLFDEYAQDFSGLIDTMYVAIQNNQTVLSGHFSNQTNSTKQTFILGTSSCSDTVSFYGNQMVKANGSFGSEDGSSVEFTFGGTAKYFNNGCKIPQQTLKVDAGTVNTQYCQGDTVHLIGTNTGAKCSWWFPADRTSGVFSDSTLNATNFIINQAYVGKIKLYFKITGNCGKTLLDSVEFSINSGSGLIALKPNSIVKWCVLNPILIKAEVSDTNQLSWEHDGYGIFIANDSISKYYLPSPADTAGVHVIIKQPSLCRLRTDTLFIDFINKPKAEFYLSDTIICKGVTSFIKLTPITTGGIFSGAGVSGNIFIPDTSGVYTIEYLLDIGGCRDSVYHKIHVLNKPDASFSVSDSIICTGEETIIFSPTDTTGYWIGGTINLNRFTPTSQGIYQISHVVFNGGCYDTVAHSFIASDRPDSKFNLSDSVLCLGESPLTLIPNNIGGTFSGQYVNGSKFYPSNTGVYPLMYTINNQGCIDSSIKTIRVASLPTPSINITPETTWVNKPIVISYNGSPVVSYIWNTGDGTTIIDSSSFSHTYNKDNFYDIELQVMNSDGCTADITKRVMILAEELLYIPNVFTPNGDGLNESFHISHSNVHQYTLNIYNRWGDKLFTSNDPDIEWDGSFQGIKCSEGVYFYTIIYRTLQGHLRDTKGTVTLLR